MAFLAELWLPILLAAVFVFIASSVFHMALPIHKNDYGAMPGEAAVLEFMRSQGVKTGTYSFPYCSSPAEMGKPEMIEKFKQGPAGTMTIVAPGPPTIGKSLLQWFLYCILIGIFVGYTAHLVLPAGTDYLKVFQITGAVAVVAYAFNDFTASIWKGQPWRTTCKFMFEGMVYGLLTAGTFAWLWPS